MVFGIKLGNLIKPDEPQAPTVTPKKATVSGFSLNTNSAAMPSSASVPSSPGPRVAEVKKVMANSAPTSQKESPSQEEFLKELISPAPVLKETPPSETSLKKEAEPAATQSVNLEKINLNILNPEITNQKIEKVEETPTKKELENKIPEKKAEEEHHGNVSEGRILVETFLKEVNDYLDAGQALTKLINEKDDYKKKMEGDKASMDILETDGKDIREALQNFLEAHDDTDQRAKLTDVLTSFAQYTTAFEQTKAKFQSEILNSNNKKLIEINAKKAEIEKMAKALGGTENIQNILAYIRKSEKRAEKANIEYGSAITSRKSEILDFVRADHEMAKAFIGRNDIVGLLMAIFTKEPKK